eukprot:Opistho-1_new@58310
MVKHNNMVPNGHFHKQWQRYVKTWFDQPGRKKRRRLARQKKALAIAPRPTGGVLRPAVRSQTNKYNTKIRAGRGFTLEELKEAGINRLVASTIGIAVDHRRTNKSVEGLQANVAHLKEYKSKLIVFPRRANKPKAGDATPAEVKTAAQLKGEPLPVVQVHPRLKARKITEDEVKHSAFRTLRIARADARLVGIREKRRKQKEEEEKMAKKSKD